MRPVPAIYLARRRGTQSLGDDGYTLIEILVAMTIAVIVIGLILVSVPLIVQLSSNTVAAGQANDRAYVVLGELQRQVVAADVIFDPATESTNAGTMYGASTMAGYSLRIYTTASGAPKCVQWRLVPPAPGHTGELQTRSWKGLDNTLTGWTTLVTGIENDPTTATTVPFVLNSNSTYGHRLLDINLVFDAGSSSTSTRRTQYQTSFAATDAQFFAPSTADSFCTPVPASTTPTST
jgi:prepilin-type N-terminal cleavage/methylation domain-containing protein